MYVCMYVKNLSARPKHPKYLNTFLRFWVYLEAESFCHRIYSKIYGNRKFEDLVLF